MRIPNSKNEIKIVKVIKGVENSSLSTSNGLALGLCLEFLLSYHYQAKDISLKESTRSVQTGAFIYFHGFHTFNENSDCSSLLIIISQQRIARRVPLRFPLIMIPTDDRPTKFQSHKKGLSGREGEHEQWPPAEPCNQFITPS